MRFIKCNSEVLIVHQEVNKPKLINTLHPNYKMYAIFIQCICCLFLTQKYLVILINTIDFQFLS